MPVFLGAYILITFSLRLKTLANNLQMEWQNKNICKYQHIPQASIYSSLQVFERKACLATHTETRKISLIEQGEESISNLQVPVEKPRVRSCLKIRDCLLNAWLSFSDTQKCGGKCFP